MLRTTFLILPETICLQRGLWRIRTLSVALTAALLLSGQAAVHAQNWQQPFTSTSIWNTPIGASPTFVDANLPAGPNISTDYINVITTSSSDPIVNVYQGGDTNTYYRGQTYFPYNLTIGSRLDTNYIAVVLEPDGQSVAQFQPLQRSTPGSDLFNTNRGDTENLLTGNGRDTPYFYAGSHSGSGLSALGGMIRAGEMSGSGSIDHALQLELDGSVLNYDPNAFTPGFRWPAYRADGAASSFYKRNGNAALVMGSLLAVPKSVSLALETTDGAKILAALQNYGGYVVDTSVNAYNIGMEGAGADYVINKYGGYPTWNSNSAWYRDLTKIITALKVVDSNDPNHIGGSATGDGNATPVFRRIALKSVATGKYVTASSSSLNAATSSTAGSAEEFDVAEGYQGEIGLRSVGNGSYVNANGSTVPPTLQATTTGFNPTAYQGANSGNRFWLIDCGDGSVSIGWYNTGSNSVNYVTLDGGDNLVAGTVDLSNAAHFTFEDNGPAGVVTAPTPVLSSLSPATRAANGPAFTLVIKGTGFLAGAVAKLGSAALTTTFVSAISVKAAVPASLITTPGTLAVTVTNPGSVPSNSKSLKVTVTSLKLTAGTVTRDPTTGVLSVPVTLKNTGYNTASALKISGSKMNGAKTSTTLPLQLGNMAAGASMTTSLWFAGNAGTSEAIVKLTVSASDMGGTFVLTASVTLP